MERPEHGHFNVFPKTNNPYRFAKCSIVDYLLKHQTRREEEAKSSTSMFLRDELVRFGLGFLAKVKFDDEYSKVHKRLVKASLVLSHVGMAHHVLAFLQGRMLGGKKAFYRRYSKFVEYLECKHLGIAYDQGECFFDFLSQCSKHVFPIEVHHYLLANTLTQIAA